MAELSALYADALFDIAMERGAADEFLEHSVFLRDTLRDDQCRRILVHPHISDKDKREFFRTALEGHIHADLLSFLYLVIDKNREAFFLPALTELIGRIERYQKKVTARVVSATALDNKQIAELKAILSKKLEKQVEVSCKVDPSLIGGPYIRADGYFIDRTVKTRLRDMTASMKERCGA